MQNIILISILLVPLSSLIPIQGTVVWYPQLLALMLIGMSCMSLGMWKVNKFIALLLVYEVFSYIFVTSQSPRSMLCLMTGFSAIAITYVVSQLKSTKDIYILLIVVAVIQSIYVVLQHFNIDPFFHGFNGKADIVGFLGSHNQVGAFYSGLGVMLAAINPLLLTFSFVPILLAKCNSAIIGLIAGLLTYGCFTWNKRLLIGLAVTICLLFIPWWSYAGKSSDELKERFSLWRLSISQVIDGKAHQVNGNQDRYVISNPLFGYGIGNFFVVSPLTQYAFLNKFVHHKYEHVHNDLIEALFELGYIGFILVLLCISKVIADFISCVHLLHPYSKHLIIYFSSLVALSVSSCSIYIFHAPVSLYLFCLILGLFYREVQYAYKSQIS